MPPRSVRHAFCFFIGAMVNQTEKRRGTADNLSIAKVSGGFARHTEGKIKIELF